MDRRAGDIVFVQSKSFFGRAVRFFTGSVWNHTYILFAEMPDAGGWLALEAAGLRVKIVHEGTFTGQRVFRPMAQTVDVNKAILATAARIGERYGFKQCLGFAWVTLCRKALGMQVRNPFRRGVICTELNFIYLTELGFSALAADEDFDSVEPDDQLALIAGAEDMFSEITY